MDADKDLERKGDGGWMRGCDRKGERGGESGGATNSEQRKGTVKGESEGDPNECKRGAKDEGSPLTLWRDLVIRPSVRCFHTQRD